jgi:hypothetical protein
MTKPSASSRWTLRPFVGVTERRISGSPGSAQALVYLFHTFVDTGAARFSASDRFDRLRRRVFADAATARRFVLIPDFRLTGGWLRARRRLALSGSLLFGAALRTARFFRLPSLGPAGGGTSSTRLLAFGLCHGKNSLPGSKLTEHALAVCQPWPTRNIHAEKTSLNRWKFGFVPAMESAVGIARQCNSYSTTLPHYHSPC